jgi:hypothetical protein
MTECRAIVCRYAEPEEAKDAKEDALGERSDAFGERGDEDK